MCFFFSKTKLTEQHINNVVLWSLLFKVFVNLQVNLSLLLMRLKKHMMTKIIARSK